MYKANPLQIFNQKFLNYFRNDLIHADMVVFLGKPDPTLVEDIRNQYPSVDRFWIFTEGIRDFTIEGAKWYFDSDQMLIDLFGMTFESCLPCVITIAKEWVGRERELRNLFLKLTQKNLEQEWIENSSPATKRLIQELFK